MATSDLMCRIAATDRTFRRSGGNWVGKCLICNGPIAFDAGTGEGGTVEHIRAKSRGGTEDLSNLAVVHGRCNWEKGQRWDPKRRRNEADYDELLGRMLIRRRDRWRDPPQ
ncbi:HNH endonuclease [Isosphaeraceae bacterium EP7]